LAMEEKLNKNGRKVQTVFVENVAEGADAERVIRDMAQQGAGLIFTPSFGYMEATMKVAADFPNVKFESITGYKTAANVSAANARYYEGRFLAGIAAGRVSKTGIAGYVAGFPIPEVIQGINAFALGMRSVNPKAEVKLIWLNNWFDPAREREAAMTLMNQKADVLAFHTASEAVMVAAQERGKLAIAYHSDMRHIAPQAQLLAVTHHSMALGKVAMFGGVCAKKWCRSALLVPSCPCVFKPNYCACSAPWGGVVCSPLPALFWITKTKWCSLVASH